MISRVLVTHIVWTAWSGGWTFGVVHQETAHFKAGTLLLALTVQACWKSEGQFQGALAPTEPRGYVPVRLGEFYSLGTARDSPSLAINASSDGC